MTQTPNGIDRRAFLGGLAGLGATTMITGSESSLAQDAPPRTTVITAPTGTIGRQVTANLLARGAKLRLIVRDPARLPAQLRERADIVQGSHGDPDVVNRAFEGADTVFWLCPPNEKAATPHDAYVGFSRPASEAIRTQRVRRVVSISALGRGTPMATEAGFVTASLAMDDLLASTGVDFRALTMPSFMDNIARQSAAIKEKGVFFSPIDGDRRMPSCATRDIAASATRLLLDPAWGGQGHLAVLGPEDISFNDMARVMSEVLRKPVKFQRTSFDDYNAMFVRFGMSEGMAEGMTAMARAKNQGLDNSEPRTPENTTPTTFRQWCEDELKPLIGT